MTSWFVSWRAEQCEEFCFRSPKFPDIKYDIYLTEDDYPSAISFWGEQQARFSSFLKKVKKNKYEAIAFYFCDAVGKLINAVSKETELRYLLLNNGSPDCDFPVFQEIGHLEQLRGLWLYGFPWIKLDWAAVKELCKLKALEALRVDASFQISVEALRELGTLRTLKALHLELRENLFWEDIRHDPSLPDTEPRRGASLHRSGIPFLPDCPVENERRSTLISALASLQRLEKLEILTLDVSPRLSPGELALPPNLKYLKINNTVCRLPVRPAKMKPVPKKAKSDDEGPSLF